MTDDVNTRMLDIDPTIPHHLMYKVAILWQTHRVNLATPAKVFSAAKVRVRIRKDDVHAACAHTLACSRPLAPVVVPAHNIFDRVRVLISIVNTRVLILIKRTGAILVIRRRELVPIFSQPFIARILHRPHWLRRALVNVEHLAAIFGYFAVEHFTRADCPAAVQIKRISQSFHLLHVRLADRFVAAFVEDDAGIVWVINAGVAYQRNALFPAPARTGSFGTTR